METVLQRTKFVKLATLLIVAAAFGGCTHLQSAGHSGDLGQLPAMTVPPTAAVAPSIGGATESARQLLLVIAEGERTSRASLHLLERESNGWHSRGGSIPAMIGRTGFAQPGEKREGDGHTPTGLFPLEFVFGYASSVATLMPYRQANADDVWVDDADSPDYNQWVKRGATTATSFEEMRRPDQYYRHGVVIGYNRQPVVKGDGSAIFLHVWRGADKSTSGCVAIDERELVGIIGWLDPAKRPMIFMGSRADLAAMPGFAELPLQSR